jgi:hypothetical protein
MNEPSPLFVCGMADSRARNDNASVDQSSETTLPPSSTGAKSIVTKEQRSENTSVGHPFSHIGGIILRRKRGEP